MEKSTI